MKWKDNFSKQSKSYAQFRPIYPKELFQWLGSQLTSKETLWDCATGNGQAASGLAPYFKKVIATDASQNQINNSFDGHNITYKVAYAEDSGFATNSVDCITVSQAAHWFAHDLFFKEVKRVLKPKGLLAIWGYGLFYTENLALNTVLKHFYTEVIGDYWDKERQYLDERYETLPFPFPLLDTPHFKMKHFWNLEKLIGYLNTWSSVQKFEAKHQKNPTHNLKEEISLVWENPSEAILFVWDIFLKIGQNK